MIILFTSNVDGGIIQFTIQILCELKKMKVPVLAYIPNKAERYIDEMYRKDIIYYNTFSVLKLQISAARCIGKEILENVPHLVWYMDDMANSSFMGFLLAKEAKQMLTLHDLEEHPSYKRSYKTVIYKYVKAILKRAFMKKADFLLCMSKNNYKIAIGKYPKYKVKMIMLTLGAHVPDKLPQKPAELSNVSNRFLLFFGRFDKYKGIERMLEAYKVSLGCKQKLVVAGRGYLTESEKNLISADERVVLINRYIEDEEMIWLFENALATVLPYNEASQSGVIPISYRYGVPVIVSNVQGLVQYVEDGRTGFVCKDLHDYKKAFEKIVQNECRAMMSNCCEQYYAANMNWENNIKSVLRKVFSEDSLDRIVK